MTKNLMLFLPVYMVQIVSSHFGQVIRQLAVTIYECYIQPCNRSHKATLLLTFFLLCIFTKTLTPFYKTIKHTFGKPFAHLIVLSRLKNSTLIRPVFICRIRYLSSLNTIAMSNFRMIPPWSACLTFYSDVTLIG